MRKKLLCLGMAVCLAAGAAGIGFAEDVYVTKNGKVYHQAGSPFIKDRETVKMTKEEAEAKGYKPSKSYLKSKGTDGASVDSDEKKSR